MTNITPDALVESFRQSAMAFPQKMINLPEGKISASDSAAGNKAQQIQEAIEAHAQKLEKDFAPYVADMKESWLKKCTIIMMENWRRATAHLDEATASAAIANFNKDMFPLIRAVLPATATEKAFTIQPMMGPVSNIFTFSPTYGTTTGQVNAGDLLYQNLDSDYGNSTIDNETVGTGDGSTSVYNYTLSQNPILAGSVAINDGAQVLSDDGAGNLVGDGTGTVDYATGAVVANFTSNVADGAVVEVSYSLDNETNIDGIPEIDLILTQDTVTAQRKAIRFRYSLTSSFALRDQYGIDAQAELTLHTGQEIAYGIDARNFKKVVNVALDKTNDTDFTFDKSTPSGISFTEYKFEFIDKLIKGSSYVLNQSGRVTPNWIVASDEITDILESIGKPRFQANPVSASRGIHDLGILDNRWQVFKIVDPANIGLKPLEFLLGHKPDSFLFAGYVWAPWIAAYETPLTILDDFNARKGMASLYGEKVVNSKYYLKMAITKS